MMRLRMKFEELRDEREALHELLADYVADYRQFNGTELARQEYLREKYAGRVGNFNHLAWSEDGEIYWGAADIAILLGRDRSAVARFLAEMKGEEGWCSRLLALCKTVKAQNGVPTEVYEQGIFDLILDRYEEAYMRRFSEPRHGSADNAPDMEEVRRFWKYLKDSYNALREHAVLRTEEEWPEEREQIELPDIPPMSWRDVASLIWRKVFTVRTGMTMTLVFAVCFEVVRRWPVLLPWIVAVSLGVLLTCAALLRFRRGSPVLLAGTGAGALLFALLWGVGLLSSDGVIYAPGGSALDLRETELTIDVTTDFFKPSYYEKSRICFTLIPSDYHNLKEVFYRLDSEPEYHSTGFNDFNYPNLGIDTDKTEGFITLEIKCLDAGGREHGPWTYSFDVDAEMKKMNEKEEESLAELLTL